MSREDNIALLTVAESCQCYPVSVGVTGKPDAACPCYSAKKEILAHVTPWVSLEDIRSVK